MPKVKIKLIRKVVNLNENQQEMLNVFTQKWGFISEADVIRQALTHYYRKMEPEYLKPSSREAERLRQQKEEERLARLTDEEYAREIMRARVFKSDTGKKYAVTMTIANRVKIWAMDTMREVDAQDSFYRETHLRMLTEGADFDEYIRMNEKRLREYGIALEEQGVSLGNEPVEPETQSETQNQSETQTNGDQSNQKPT